MAEPSVASTIRRRVVRSTDRFWRTDDFEGPPAAVAQTLSRLARAGDVRRVRRGLYWRGASTALGMAPPPSDRFVNEVVGPPGAGPAGWSAAVALGLSTQVPRQETVAVVGRAPRSLGSVRFVSRAACVKRRDERLRPPEVALLEILREWDDLVELSSSTAVRRIANLAGSSVLRLDRIIRASPTEPPRVRERLRRLLLHMGRPDEADHIRPPRSSDIANDSVLAVPEPGR